VITGRHCLHLDCRRRVVQTGLACHNYLPDPIPQHLHKQQQQPPHEVRHRHHYCLAAVLDLAAAAGAAALYLLAHGAVVVVPRRLTAVAAHRKRRRAVHFAAGRRRRRPAAAACRQRKRAVHYFENAAAWHRQQRTLVNDVVAIIVGWSSSSFRFEQWCWSSRWFQIVIIFSIFFSRIMIFFGRILILWIFLVVLQLPPVHHGQRSVRATTAAVAAASHTLRSRVIVVGTERRRCGIVVTFRIFVDIAVDQMRPAPRHGYLFTVQYLSYCPDSSLVRMRVAPK
jgi:hypothetical protein